jgi:hypothetical protein
MSGCIGGSPLIAILILPLRRPTAPGTKRIEIPQLLPAGIRSGDNAQLCTSWKSGSLLTTSVRVRSDFLPFVTVMNWGAEVELSGSFPNERELADVLSPLAMFCCAACGTAAFGGRGGIEGAL